MTRVSADVSTHRNRRRSRRATPLRVAIVALLLIGSACSSASDPVGSATTDPAGATTGAPDEPATVPTTTTPPTSTPTPTPTPDAAPPSTTSPPVTTTVPELDLPEMPDPVDLASTAIGGLDGFTPIDEAPTALLDTADFKFGYLSDGVVRSVIWDYLDHDGDDVLIFSFYPYAEFRADPLFAAGLAEDVAYPDASVETVEVDGSEVARVKVDEASDDWWYVWGGDSVAMMVIGPDTAAELALTQLMSRNSDVYLWDDGDCLLLVEEDGLFLPYGPYGDDLVVPCDGAHTHEVIASQPFDGSDYPDDDAITGLTSTCGASFEDHVGSPHIDTLLDSTIYLPDGDEWEQGKRYGVCVIGRWDGKRFAATETGFAGRDDLRFVRSVGDCHGDGGIWSPAVDCARPHELEFIGTTIYPGDIDAPYPASDEVLTTTDARCDDVLLGYADDTNRRGGYLYAIGILVDPHQWGRGERTIYCFAFAADDNDDPMRIEGPLPGDWRLVPLADDVVTA